MCLTKPPISTYSREKWTECAQRETEEETGLKIKNLKLGTVVNTIVKDVQYHYVTVFMEADLDVEQSGKTDPVNMEPHKCESKSIQSFNITTWANPC